jgi:hypothetical protein
MIRLDEDALICDLAETYHIFDYRSLPLRLVATLSAGLRDSSRIKLKAAGSPVNQDTILLAMIADRVEMFRYGFSEDASKGLNMPPSILEMLMGEIKPKQQNKAIVSFSSGKEFDEALAKLRGK